MRLLALLSGLLLMQSALQAQEVQTHAVLKGEAGKPTVIITVESVFSLLPLHGVAPVRVTIENGSTADHTWRLAFESTSEDDRLLSQFEMESKKGASTTVELLVPVATYFSTSSYTYDQRLKYTIKANKISAETGSFTQSCSSDWPAILMSKGLSVRNSGPLNDAVDSITSSSSDTFAVTAELTSLPSSWRGYCGLDVVILTDTEWLKLQTEAPAVSQALLEWSRLGGQLDIYSKQGMGPEALGIKGVKSGTRSLGSLHFYQWNGSAFDPAEMVGRYESLKHRHQELSDSSGATQTLVSELGLRSFGNWQVALILIAFGVIVGPVNLFVFAKPGRRHRLFWTTPLISLIASALLVLLILVQDGTGGKGERLVLVNVEPAETNAYITQYQASRTGVLFSGAFEAKDLFISQTVLNDSPWSAVDAEGGLAKRYNVDGNVYGGDWFQSRREHGHYLQSVRSTRGRIELVSEAGQPPVIVSSFGFALTRLAYLDADNSLWMSKTAVPTGDRVTLEPATKGDEKTMFPAALGSSDIDVGTLFVPGQFVATAERVPELTIETLGSIEWKDRAVLFGPMSGTQN
ncbi:MAG: hypothetical protein R3F19_16070 [Verrucomicrobiales bacterium]